MRSIHLDGVLLCVLAVLTCQAANPAPEKDAVVSPGLQAPEWAKTLPKDVYPETGNRLPLPKQEELEDFAKWHYDEIANDRDLPKGIHLVGPRPIMLYSPLLAEYQTDMRRYLSELVILVTARGQDNQWQWAERSVIAARAGLEQNIMDIVKDRKPLTGLGEKEATIIPEPCTGANPCVR